jgi:hypothetical protein
LDCADVAIDAGPAFLRRRGCFHRTTNGHSPVVGVKRPQAGTRKTSGQSLTLCGPLEMGENLGEVNPRRGLVNHKAGAFPTPSRTRVTRGGLAARDDPKDQSFRHPTCLARSSNARFLFQG